MNVKRQQEIISSVSESMFLLNKKKQIVAIYNFLPAAMAGYTKNDIIGKHLSVFSEDKNSPFYEACHNLDQSFDRIMVSRQNEFFEYKINDSFLEANIKLLKGDYVLSTVRDITDIIKKQEKTISKSRNELSVALTAGGLTSWRYDVDSQTFSSAHINNVIGSKTAYDDLLSKIHPDDKKIVSESIDALVTGKSTHVHFVSKVTNNNGVVQWSNVHGVPHEYDEKGNVKTIIGSQKDVTIDIETRNELIRLRDKAEESNRLKTAFLANMSHEIRTPLNAIVGFSSLMADTEDKDEIEEYRKIIELNNTLLLNIINDILDLSKIESGKIDFSQSEINVYDLLSQFKQTSELKVKEGVQVILENTDKDINILSDRNRLAQVIGNLLNNAVKFTYKGFIRLGCKIIQNELYFYVEDTGVGIPEENLANIFDRFVKLNYFEQGTGLGLSICYSIIQFLGGRMGVESENGVGSTFWFTLPAENILQKKETLPNLPEEDNKVTTFSSQEIKVGTILIAEDNPSNYLLFEKILTGYTLIHAWNGKEAVDLFKKESPSLVFMDIRMPEMDGYEATRIIRNYSTNVPIVAVTASVLQEEHANAMEKGFTDFIPKPVNIVQLRNIVKKYIS